MTISKGFQKTNSILSGEGYNEISQSFLLNDHILEQDQDAVNSVARDLFEDLRGGQLTEIFKPAVDTSYINGLAEDICSECEHLVIIGTGASSIIPKALFSLIPVGVKLQVHFLEDADALKFESVILKLKPDSTRFLVITKSGRTVEILALLSLCLEWAKNSISMVELSKMFYFVTAKGENNSVLKIANNLKAKVIDHPCLSGRYSFFSVLGLLPAAIAGFNIDLILKHAGSCIDGLFQKSSWILEGTAYLVNMSKKYHNTVLMTYSSTFYGFGLWFRQLISESLGKAGKGVNPIVFEGNIDQHSQLQSYLDGLPDKFFTVLVPDINIKTETRIKSPTFELDHLAGKTLYDINKLQINSVIELLKNAGKNIRIIEITAYNERFIAEVAACFMIETILYAKLNNIDPFTQTAIEVMKDTVREAITAVI